MLIGALDIGVLYHLRGASRLDFWNLFDYTSVIPALCYTTMLELAAQAPRNFLLLHCLSFWLLLTIYPSCRSLAIVAMLDTPFRPIVW